MSKFEKGPTSTSRAGQPEAPRRSFRKLATAAVAGLAAVSGALATTGEASAATHNPNTIEVAAKHNGDNSPAISPRNFCSVLTYSEARSLEPVAPGEDAEYHRGGYTCVYTPNPNSSPNVQNVALITEPTGVKNLWRKEVALAERVVKHPSIDGAYSAKVVELGGLGDAAVALTESIMPGGTRQQVLWEKGNHVLDLVTNDGGPDVPVHNNVKPIEALAKKLNSELPPL